MLLVRLDLLHERHGALSVNGGDLPLQVIERDRRQLELDHTGVGHELVSAAADDEVVQGDGVSLGGDLVQECQDIGVGHDGLQDLEDHAVRCEHQMSLAPEHLGGDVQPGGDRTHRGVEPQLDDGPVDESIVASTSSTT